VDRDIAEFQRAEAEVTESEGAIVMVRVEFAQQLRGRTSGVKSLKTGVGSKSSTEQIVGRWPPVDEILDEGAEDGLLRISDPPRREPMSPLAGSGQQEFRKARPAGVEKNSVSALETNGASGA
jgi:hypothetical protein